MNRAIAALRAATHCAGRTLGYILALALIGTRSPAAPPEPITDPLGKFDGFAVPLSWSALDARATGVLIERCLVSPQSPVESHSEAAAVLQADARTLRHVGLRLWGFRAASFNADGLSAPCELTPFLGETLKLDLGSTADLPASASQIATLIRALP